MIQQSVGINCTSRAETASHSHLIARHQGKLKLLITGKESKHWSPLFLFTTKLGDIR